MPAEHRGVIDEVEALPPVKPLASKDVFNEVLEAIALLENSLGVKAKVKFEPRPPGDPMRTRADASRLAADLDYATAVGIADGLAAEAEWARTLYGNVR